MDDLSSYAQRVYTWALDQFASMPIFTAAKLDL